MVRRRTPQKPGLATAKRAIVAQTPGDDGRAIELAMSERFAALSLAVRYSSDGVVLGVSTIGPRSVVIDVNDAFLAIIGAERETVVGQTPFAFLERDNDLDVLVRMESEVLTGGSSRAELQYKRKDGEKRWVDIRVASADGDGSATRHWIAIARDNTESRLNEQTFQERSNLLEAIARGAPFEAVLARIVAFVERALPGAIGSLMLRRRDRLQHATSGPNLPAAFIAEIASIPIAEGAGSCGTAAFRAAPVFVDDIASDPLCKKYRSLAQKHGLRANRSFPILSAGGEVLGTVSAYGIIAGSAHPRTVSVLEEATNLAAIAIERHADLTKLRDVALRDALTQLPNRELFEERLRRAIAYAQRLKKRLGIALLDLDRFKIVNDSLGHRAGDGLIREVALRLRRAVRKSDTLGRLGGDEFVLLMTGIVDAADAERRTRELHAALRAPFQAGEQEVYVRASSGVSLCPEDAIDPAQLLQCADRAMYAAKLRGRELAFYDPSKDASHDDRLGLESALRRALAQGEFVIAYQKQIDLATRALRGVEALLRWNSPVLGLLKPDDFIHIAEETGLIVPIGAWVLRQACRRGRQFTEAGLDVSIAVNVSARQFEDGMFVETVRGALVESGLRPARLHLELTETMLMRSPLTAAAMLAELKSIGVKIVMDDFGTGYSSLAYLKQFPMDVLKIDRSFVRDVGTAAADAHDRAIVSAIVAIAAELGLTTVAEGIETEAQLAFLREHGCNIGQGYLFGDYP